MILLQRRNENRRGDNPADRVHPAGQGFQRGAASRFRFRDSLVIHPEPVIVQRLFVVFHDIQFIPVLLIRVRRPETPDPVHIRADPPHRVACMIHRFGAAHIPGHLTDSGYHAGRVSISFPADAPVGLLDFFAKLHSVFRIGDQDNVVFHATDKQAVRESFLQHGSNQADQLIALFESVLVVIGLH